MRLWDQSPAFLEASQTQAHIGPGYVFGGGQGRKCRGYQVARLPSDWLVGMKAGSGEPLHCVLGLLVPLRRGGVSERLGKRARPPRALQEDEIGEEVTVMGRTPEGNNAFGICAS
jgi:hypothetical protein